MASAYETVIGLEIHAQLPTKSKLFCGCSTHFGQESNTHICPVCLGLPGALPVLNAQALRFAVRAALALGLEINRKSIFDRKNYFYPDLPKGYQISQMDLPYCERGEVEIEVKGKKKKVGVTRIHMEEDAGKNVHGVGGDSAVDLNRAGTPLIEIVSEPDMRSSAEAAAYMRQVRDILLFVGVNDGNLEEGSFRCDANVSIRPRGQKEFGTRVELKNINSFRFVQKAIDVEVARQKRLLDAADTVRQETRGYDSENQRTYPLRSKEDAHDYRYFPDPDLPPVLISDEMLRKEEESLPELPDQVAARLAEGKVAAEAISTLTQHPGYIRFVDAAVAAAGGELPLKKVANFVVTEVLRGASTHGLGSTFTVSPPQVGELLSLVEAGKISGKQAKEVFALLENTEKMPAAVVAEKGLEVVSDTGELETILQGLIEKNPSQVEGLKGGKTKLMGFFVGQAMKATKGSADPRVVTDLLKKLLEL
ncbi:MAG: Asp-tRNA(Asn)/Glu-tRNA(Gln) amidotransferase subunit GatB [Polyangiaceae bacterium]|nr:Asp-tRNA(Asn)/Glu-tRNA(Gln) amidotransferase subunit GatB [Polyangiaceae bacterium]